MMPIKEKPLKKSKSLSTTINDCSNKNTAVTGCATCFHNPDVKDSIDDAAPVCWNCVNAMRTHNFPYPYWTPKHEDSTD